MVSRTGDDPPPLSLLLPRVCPSKKNPCVDSNVPVCTGTTPTCVTTCGRGAGSHGDVLNPHTGFFSACHTTHHTPHHNTTLHSTAQHNTHHNTQQGTTTRGDRDRQRQRERDRERRQRKKERREDMKEKMKDKIVDTASNLSHLSPSFFLNWSPLHSSRHAVFSQCFLTFLSRQRATHIQISDDFFEGP